jgi:hypothetical protein
MKRRNFFLSLAAIVAPVKAVFASAKPAPVVPPVSYTEWFEMTLRPNREEPRFYDLLVRRYRKGIGEHSRPTKLMGSSTFYKADRDGGRILRAQEYVDKLYAKHPTAEPPAAAVSAIMFTTLTHQARIRAQYANVLAYGSRALDSYWA